MVLVWNRHKPVVELNWLMGSQPFPLDNWISMAIPFALNYSLLLKRMYQTRRVACICVVSIFVSTIFLLEFLLSFLTKWYGVFSFYL